MSEQERRKNVERIIESTKDMLVQVRGDLEQAMTRGEANQAARQQLIDACQAELREEGMTEDKLWELLCRYRRFPLAILDLADSVLAGISVEDGSTVVAKRDLCELLTALALLVDTQTPAVLKKLTASITVGMAKMAVSRVLGSSPIITSRGTGNDLTRELEQLLNAAGPSGRTH